MERIDPTKDSIVVVAEHVHRYEWASKHAYGVVADISCGIGYGSKVLLSESKVSGYVGVDIDERAVALAQETYCASGATFVAADCRQLPMPEASFDTVVSLETLEHVPDVNAVIREFRRVLRPGGVLLGSVPAASYEQLCTEIYGPNEYHVHQFHIENLQELIGSAFPFVRYYVSSVDVVSIVREFFSHGEILTHPATLRSSDGQIPPGSILFVASDTPLSPTDSGQESDTRWIQSLVEYDRTHSVDRERAIARQTEMIDERDALIKQQDQIIADYKLAVDHQTTLIDERDILIKEHNRIISNYEEVLTSQKSLIDERNAVIRDQDAVIRDQDALLIQYKNSSDSQQTVINGLTQAKEELEDLVHQYRHKLEQQGAIINTLGGSARNLAHVVYRRLFHK